MYIEHAVYEEPFNGLAAIWMKFGKYQAAIIPEFGGNLVAFRDTERGYRFLREPEEDAMDDFTASPSVYGIPYLFPPNRYEDGKFSWNGTTYELPINEKETNNHLHGFLHAVPWDIEAYGTTEAESYVLLRQKVDQQHPMYRYIPFQFTVHLRYSLDKAGLHQQYSIVNEGTAAMPNLFAFHTAINAPFDPDSSPDDYRIKVTIGERIELNGRSLPTGGLQPLSAEEQAMKTEGVNPYFAALDNHYTAVPQNGRNYMELTDIRTGVKLIYDVGTSYKHWMIWNNGACRSFICPEPQMNRVNAPNLRDITPEEAGLIQLLPGERFEQSASLYCIYPD
ncbi:aldose 1-epimerase [Paenibacillus sp. P96]|uniref:Aldose 1-epimerase n=1 Tax=Paenibacillus zeirhizosphaerae TaxID=2987519 RepID=A0ABT9FW53_9BACL|nr:aldose 1-epimerase [Paenibacillus sp. P96]MDP4098712.1 aldose 1-epimerase [Paenibacillus sp. P96]